MLKLEHVSKTFNLGTVNEKKGSSRFEPYC